MFFQMMLFVWQFVLDLIAVMRMTDDEKDLEILLLRQQLRIVERKQERGPQIPRWQKVPLGVSHPVEAESRPRAGGIGRQCAVVQTQWYSTGMMDNSWA